MITFITTLYNEEDEIEDLLWHVFDYVDYLSIIDDGSTDNTAAILRKWWQDYDNFKYKTIEHTGLCEIGRIKALEGVKDDSWVIMLDADERFEEGVLPKIVEWIYTNPAETHMYFTQLEFIDGKQVRVFQKVKVFKKSVAHLPEIIHGDPIFDGNPVSFNWTVLHRKTTNKQIQREIEYLVTYQKLFDEGKIDEGKLKWFQGMHHFVFPKG